MSLLSSLKRALGRSSSEDEDEDYITYGSSTDNGSTVSENNENNKPMAVNVVEFNDSDELPEGIFDGLVDVVNANLSPMVLKCLDVEAEKRYLYEALGSKFKDFIKSTRDKSLAYARSEWDREKGELNSRIADFKERCEAAENEMKEMKAAKMSEDRQKLALKERIRTLEDQVASAEAEKEQFDLENKSLLNKLKVSQVKSGALEEAETEIVELKAEIARMKAQPLDGYVPEDEVKALEEEYKGKMEVNNALVDELRSEATRNKEQLEARDAEVADLKTQLQESATKLESTQNELGVSNAELESVKNELSEASAGLSVLDDIQEQLNKVEDFKKKKENEIAELHEKLTLASQEHENAMNDKDAQLKELEALRDSLQEKLAKAETLLEERAKKDVSQSQEAKATVRNLETQLQSASDRIQEQEKRIVELESDIEEYSERVNSLSQENTDTLELLHKKDEQLEAKASELVNLKGEYDSLKADFDTEVNRLKTVELEKTQKFQAEIAELQAKLNVNGKIDDYLVDDDLKQAVEETFDVQFDEGGFDEFAPLDDAPAPKTVEDAPAEDTSAEVEVDELDDIDWLIPDTVESVHKELEIKREKEEQENKDAIGAIEENDFQMSLF